MSNSPWWTPETNTKEMIKIGIDTLIQNIESTYTIDTERITEEQAIYLSEQMKKSPTVVFRTPERLISHTKENQCIKIIDWQKLIWFITVDAYPEKIKWQVVYEGIWLWVDEKYRWKNFWKYLLVKSIELMDDKAIVSHTKNDIVWYVTEHYFGYKQVMKDELWEDIKTALEYWRPKWEEYKSYVNKTLFSLMKNKEN